MSMEADMFVEYPMWFSYFKDSLFDQATNNALHLLLLIELTGMRSNARANEASLC